MSDRDDGHRRFMTPPKEWGDDGEAYNDALTSNHDALNENPGNDVLTASEPHDTHSDVTPWLDHAEADDYVNTPHDDSRAAVMHDDEFEVEASAVVRQDSSIEPDILTDHHVTPVSQKTQASLWPLLVVGFTLALLVLGGWGAINERSRLTARIAELESADSRVQQRGDLSLADEQALQAENLRLSTQLDELREQYSEIAQQLSELEATTVAAGIANPQTLASAALPEPSNPSPSTREDSAVPNIASQASVGTGDWFVNVAAYSQSSAAQTWVDKITALIDETVISSEVTVNNKTLYRVRIVGLADRAAAQALAGRLEDTYSIGPLWVGKGEANSAATTSASLSAPVSSQRSEATKPASGNNSEETPAKPVELRNFSNNGGWFIYIDTFAQNADADTKALEISEAGYDAKVAVEYRSGELFYRVQVVGISSREEGEAIAEALSKLGDMPNLQLRQY